jgi:hypothetical protein
LAISKNELPKVAVESQHNAIIRQGSAKQFNIGGPDHLLGCIEYVIPAPAQMMNDFRREVLVGKVSLAHTDALAGGST